jgi:hypothetical protein
MGSHRKEDLAASDSTTANLHIDELKKRFSSASWGDLLKEIFSTSSSSAPKVWALGVIDRVLRTLVQATVGYITAINLIASPDNFDLIQFAGIIGGAAVVSVGTSLIAAPTFDSSWWYQILERAVKTFTQVFIAGIVTISIDGELFSAVPTGVKELLSTAGIAALVSVGTSIMSTSIGHPDRVDLVVPPEKS